MTATPATASGQRHHNPQRRKLNPMDHITTGPLRFFLMEDGRVIERESPPPGWLEGYHSISEMRFAFMTPDGSDDLFRAKLIGIADELAALESGTDLLKDCMKDGRCDSCGQRPSTRLTSWRRLCERCRTEQAAWAAL
jgi:hypothetical protein